MKQEFLNEIIGAGRALGEQQAVSDFDGQPNAPPTSRLVAEMRVLSVLERAIRASLQDCATELRASGATWREIGEAAGTSLQNAHSRWRRPTSTGG